MPSWTESTRKWEGRAVLFMIGGLVLLSVVQLTDWGESHIMWLSAFGAFLFLMFVIEWWARKILVKLEEMEKRLGK